MVTTDIESKALAVVSEATRLVIRSTDDYALAGALWAQLQDAKRDINDTFGPIIDKAHKAHKEAIAQRDKFLKPVDDASRKLKQGLSDYDAEQKRLREAEQRRIESELRAREEERLLQEALEAEKAGQREEAEAIISEPVVVPTVTLPKTTPKVDGLVFREVWDADLIHANIGAIAQAVSNGELDATAIELSASYWRDQARSRKTLANEAWQKFGIRAYSRRV